MQKLLRDTLATDSQKVLQRHMDQVPEQVTILQVARHAGVSATTVSHVLSGNRPVAAATRERVERAIGELGFRPNGLARSLRTRRSHTVGLLLPDITNPWYPVLSRGLQDALAADGYHAFLCNTDADEDREVEFLDDLVDRRVDGIVLAAPRVPAGRVCATILRRGIALVVAGNVGDWPGADMIVGDDVGAAAAATRHLLDRGHRRVAHVAGTPGMHVAADRLDGYRRALDEAGVAHDPALVVAADFTRAGGAVAMRALLALPEPPTAVFAANDLLAIGALDVIREHGLTVPGDVALVGFDDIDAAALMSPPLTTVVNPAYEWGQTAGRVLLDRMLGRVTGPARRDLIPYRIVYRSSA
jgi:LacI family transcriptional regulator